MTQSRAGLTLAAVFLAISVVLTGCGGGGKPAAQVPAPASTGDQPKLDGEMNVFNWSEYLPQEVIDEFSREYGVKVNYDTYSSNEEMLAKIQSGASGYDLVVPSDFMMQVMVKKDLLEPIDLSAVPNFKNIGDQYKNQAYDPGNKYSVPYMWGDAVIAVNTDKVKRPITSWKDLWDPAFKGKVVSLNDMRFVIGATLKTLGYGMNETDPAKLDQAKAKLKELAPNVKVWDSDSPKTSLLNGEAWIGLVWGAEGVLARRENPAIQVVYPTEGIGLWQDNMAIPRGAKHKRTAEAFMNFVLRPEIHKKIADAFPYNLPNVEAQKLLDPSVLGDPQVYPPQDVLAKGEWLRDLGDTTQLYDRIWTEVKGQ